MVGNMLKKVKKWEDLPVEIKGPQKNTVRPSFKINKNTLPYIDSKIRKTVVLLNEVGYKTVGSCQGHFDQPRGWNHPFVGMYYKNIEDVKKLTQVTKKQRGKSIHYHIDKKQKGVLIRFTAKDNKTRDKQVSEFNKAIRQLVKKG